jgi:hypothetical protein
MGRELDAVAPPLVAVTSLAIGADQLLARLVLERGGVVHALLPFAGIERTFASADLPAYRELVSRARVEILDTPGTDEDAFLAAGERVVEASELMLAVWNGLPARGKGGTADVVRYALSRGTPVVHINPVDRTVTRR